MRRQLLGSKIYRATGRSVDLHYEGSLTLDETLLEAADLLPFEQVQGIRVNNRVRRPAYVIPGPRGCAVVELNGAAARLALSGDVVTLSFAAYDEWEAQAHQPRVVLADAQNHIARRQLRAER